MLAPNEGGVAVGVKGSDYGRANYIGTERPVAINLPCHGLAHNIAALAKRTIPERQTGTTTLWLIA